MGDIQPTELEITTTMYRLLNDKPEDKEKGLDVFFFFLFFPQILFKYHAVAWCSATRRTTSVEEDGDKPNDSPSRQITLARL